MRECMLFVQISNIYIAMLEYCLFQTLSTCFMLEMRTLSLRKHVYFLFLLNERHVWQPQPFCITHLISEAYMESCFKYFLLLGPLDCFQWQFLKPFTKVSALVASVTGPTKIGCHCSSQIRWEKLVLLELHKVMKRVLVGCLSQL